MANAVLILTARFDPTADLVVEQLTARGVSVFRCDSADFPERLSLRAELAGEWSGRLRLPRRTVDLQEIHSAYYRRPSGFQFSDSMAAHDRSWAGLQARLGLGGILAALPQWLNHPSRIGLAEYKPVQLTEAANLGLTVPRTLITNEPAAARDFANEVGQLVYKPLATEGAGSDNDPMVIYTTDVSADQLDDPAIAGTAHMFQQRIEKEHEVRLTVVDDEFFATRITTHSPKAATDWRSDTEALEYTTIETPPEVRRAVTALLHRFQLRFGALDFAVTPAGEWVFFELNPNGQWGWIQLSTGAPIAAAIARALSS